MKLSQLYSSMPDKRRPFKVNITKFVIANKTDRPPIPYDRGKLVIGRKFTPPAQP